MHGEPAVVQSMLVAVSGAVLVLLVVKLHTESKACMREE